MSIFQRNAIISGYINSYCLVCECYFETEDQTFSHIISEGHESRLESYSYLEKYGNNCIRKVKAGYFCEHCGLLMTTAVKVNLHIAEKLHYYNKGNSLLKQFGSVLTAFDDVVITERAWHSFVDDACAMCDVEFDDVDEHKMKRSHVLKLLQNKVEFGVDNSIYRKIDKSHFQCLTCDIVSDDTLEQHLNDDIHKQMYIQCQEEKNKFDKTNPKVIKPANRTEIKEIEKVEKKVTDVALNNIDTITGEPVDDKDETKKAVNTLPEIKTELNNIETIASDTTLSEVKTELKPVKAKKPAEKKKEPKIYNEDISDPVAYAKHNNLLFDPKRSNAFCRICEKKFPSTLRGMKEHAQGRDHINKTAKAASKPTKKHKLKTQLMDNFVFNIRSFNNTLDNDIIINEIMCVPEKSCNTFTKINSPFDEYKCYICLENVSEDELDDHCRTAKHGKGMRESAIVLGLNNEHIRELRPDSFHCGYCNQMLAGWPAVEEHLKTAEHKASYDSCHRRLQTHLAVIKAQKDDDIVKAAFLEMFIKHIKRI